MKTSLVSSSSIRLDTIKECTLNQGDNPYYYITSFRYGGKLLLSSNSNNLQKIAGPGGMPVYYGTSVRTDFYYYNNNDQLTNTSISPLHGGPVAPQELESSKVTYADGHISTIEFFTQRGISCKKFFLTYSKDQLTEIYEPNTVKINYEYDAKGNNTKEIYQLFINGAPIQNAVITQISTFDDKPNFQKTLPLWVYFKCYDLANIGKPDMGVDFTVLQKGFTDIPGANNPLTLSTTGHQSAFTYKYFDNGYPFEINDSQYIWHYSYSTVQ